MLLVFLRILLVFYAHRVPKVLKTRDKKQKCWPKLGQKINNACRKTKNVFAAFQGAFLGLFT
jgi:hypothetical protein